MVKEQCSETNIGIAEAKMRPGWTKSPIWCMICPGLCEH